VQLFTYSDIKTKLLNDLDIQDLDFINGETELLGYINEALNDAEALVHTLGLEADYFLTPSTITLVSGTEDYVLPTNIYASKIKALFYVNGEKKYEIIRIRNLRETPYFQAGEYYKYQLLTTTGTANNMRMRLYPTPAESGAFLTMWYIRNLTTMTTSTAATNVCELPESVNFLLQHCKVRIYEKMGNPNLQLAMQQLLIQKQLMVETLQEMVPDENTLVEPDLSFYEDAYSDRWNTY